MERDDKIFNNNPLYMKSLIGKEVDIKTVDNKLHTGIVFVIDPIFKIVVLHKNWKSSSEYDSIIILHHAIESLVVVSETVKENYLKEKSIPSHPLDIDRKTTVKNWLKGMMIDVKESGDYLKIDDHLVIVPPYEPENCICNNTIILEKIRKILGSIPHDFSE